jgi:hypothetical protein
MARGYADAGWKRLRAAILARDPWCVLCLAEGERTPSTVADHVIPRRRFPLALQRSSAPNGADWHGNLRGVCKSHHARRSEDKAVRSGKWRANPAQPRRVLHPLPASSAASEGELRAKRPANYEPPANEIQEQP